MSESARKRRGSKIAFSGGHRNSSSGSGGEERGISSSSDGAEGRLGCLTVEVSQIAIFTRQVVLVLRLKEVRDGGCDPGVSGPGAGRGLCQVLAELPAVSFEHFLVRLRRFRMARADFRAQRSATSAVAGKAAVAEQKQAGTDWLRACVLGGTLAAPPPCAYDPFASRRRKRLAMATGKKGSTANSGAEGARGAVRAHSG